VTAARPLKILRVIARLNVGGPARHVVLLNRGLQARGHDALLVHGAVGPGEASLERLAEAGGVRVEKLAELGPRISAFSDLRAFARLLRITFREAPDVIHTHTAKAGTLARLSAAIFNLTRRRARRAVVVHTFHGHVLDGYFGLVGNALVRTAERSLARVTDCIVTISPSQRRDIVERFHVAPAARVVTIPLGLDLDALLNAPAVAATPTLREALSIPPGDFVVGFVGRFVAIKDLRTLVDAFGQVVREVPHARLLLAGDGPTRGELQHAATAAGVADRVHFLGWTEDLVSVYAAMDVCALSSLNEGTPVALIEAMAAGKPVVATRVGGVPDLVDDGRTGLLVAARDSAALARSLVTLAADPPLRARLGGAARADVQSRFSHDRLVDDIDRLYAERLAIKRGTIAD
jgi:glycosyltransferase involved in cell wall biosynthesis